MANKTKAQLLEEIEVLENSLQEANIELERFQRYEDYDRTTGDIKIFHEKLIDAGFDKEQAFELTKAATPKLIDETLRDERAIRWRSRPGQPRYR